MDSDFQHQKQLNSGLARYQSAPSSYFSNFLDGDSIEDFLNGPSSPETERIFSRFLSSAGGSSGNSNDNVSGQNFESINDQEIEVKIEPRHQIMDQMNNESGFFQQQENRRDYSSPSQGFCQSQRFPPNPNSGSSMDYRMSGPMGMGRLPPMRTGGTGNSNLTRHQSSPAGLFSNLDIESFGVMKGLGHYRANLVSSNPEVAFPSASRPFASFGLMNPFTEMVDKNMGEDRSCDAAGFGDNIRTDYSIRFPIGSGDDSGMRRLTDEDTTVSVSNAYEIQNTDAGNRPPLLAHHLSLPNASAEMPAFEKLMQFQDSVPCKMRAKRGFATHPRSIAERVRRTKISERMRKLQDLVPNMDKQTSTADMLDLAVDYIKDLQKQVKVLSDGRERCRCSNYQQQQPQPQ